MATPDLTAGQVMDAAAALYNDTAKSVVTYAIQIPYLNIALRNLQEEFELNEIPVTETVTSSPMTVPAGVTEITFTNNAGLILPSDLIEPQMLWERQSGVDPYVPMTKLNVLPRYMEGVEINQFIYFTWQSQAIRFLAASQDNDIKMDYIRNLFTTVTLETDSLAVINAESYLSFRTAALLAEFVGENKTRADSLNIQAINSLDVALGIGTKGRQDILVRHRPFRSSYKRRSYM